MVTCSNRGQSMNVQRRPEVKESTAVPDKAALASARGGLKAERVEGSDPAAPGGS
jgi:hypothetical protein